MVYLHDYFMSLYAAHGEARRRASAEVVRYRVRPIPDPELPGVVVFQVLPSLVAEPCS